MLTYRFLACWIASLVLFPAGVFAQSSSLSADALEKRPNVSRFSGNVGWTIDGYRFSADVLCHDPARLSVKLIGNVQTLELNGNLVATDNIRLPEEFGVKFAVGVASEGARVGVVRLVEQPDASPEPCEASPGRR